MRRLLPLLVIAALSIGCAAQDDEDTGSSDDALSLVSLTANGCKKPVVKTKASTDKSGAVIAGTANTSINGCIVGKPGETGKDVSARLVKVLGDTPRIGLVRAEDGSTVFSKFTPGATTGTLATGLVQDVDVTLAAFASPSSRLRITRRLGADGVYSLHITNVTPFKASIAFVNVTAILPENLDLRRRPEIMERPADGNRMET